MQYTKTARVTKDTNIIKEVEPRFDLIIEITPIVMSEAAVAGIKHFSQVRKLSLISLQFIIVPGMKIAIKAATTAIPTPRVPEFIANG